MPFANERSHLSRWNRSVKTSGLIKGSLSDVVTQLRQERGAH